jgi:hypothetical protein
MKLGPDGFIADFTVVKFGGGEQDGVLVLVFML